MRWIQVCVQKAHFHGMRVGVEEWDFDGVVGHIRFLYLDHEVLEDEYRLSTKESFTIVSTSLLALSSKALGNWNVFVVVARVLITLVPKYIAIQDQLLVEDISAMKSSNNPTPFLLQEFLNYVSKLDSAYDPGASKELAISSCLRDLFHFARISGLHVLECVMDATLSFVKEEKLEEASILLLLFSRLRPLVAVMGWDLLPTKIAARRKMMRLLGTTKSHVHRLEDLSLHENQVDELDLASFVACVNSGQPRDIRSSLFFSRQEQREVGDEHVILDRFVENFVLERLSFQTPLRVLGAAINVYANRHKERPDRLIDMLTSSHRKVLACGVCGRLKSAFQIASRSGSVADVQNVAHQALHANALPVLDMCKQWLAQYMWCDFLPRIRHTKLKLWGVEVKTAAGLFLLILQLTGAALCILLNWKQLFQCCV
ncbi:hypothetical protein AKJ16_DCAP09249 [Drosera capensis]